MNEWMTKKEYKYRIETRVRLGCSVHFHFLNVRIRHESSIKNALKWASFVL